jgi:hypothetical protein
MHKFIHCTVVLSGTTSSASHCPLLSWCHCDADYLNLSHIRAYVRKIFHTSICNVAWQDSHARTKVKIVFQHCTVFLYEFHLVHLTASCNQYVIQQGFAVCVHTHNYRQTRIFIMWYMHIHRSSTYEQFPFWLVPYPRVLPVQDLRNANKFNSIQFNSTGRSQVDLVISRPYIY